MHEFGPVSAVVIEILVHEITSHLACQAVDFVVAILRDHLRAHEVLDDLRDVAVVVVVVVKRRREPPGDALAVVVGAVVVRQPRGPSAPVVGVIRVGPVAQRDPREAPVRVVGVGGGTRRQAIIIRRRDSGNPPGVRVVVPVLPLEAVDVSGGVRAEVMIRGPADAVVAQGVFREAAGGVS